MYVGLPSISDVIFVITMVAVLWLGPFIANRDGDLGWHIGVGRLILATGAIPTSEPFSYTMGGETIITRAWLGSTVFAWVYGLGGFPAVGLFTATLVALTFAGISELMKRLGISPLLIMALGGLGVLASVAHWATRPHLFSFLLSLLWFAALEAHRRGGGRRWLWALPLLMVLWANLHGAFLIGLQLTATYLLGAALSWLLGAEGERRRAWGQARELAVALVAAGGAVLVNPAGVGLIADSASFFGQDYFTTMIPDFGSPDFHNPLFYPLLALLVLIVAGPRPLGLTPKLLLLLWAAFALYSFRNLLQLIIVALPLLGEAWQARLRAVAPPRWAAGLFSRVTAIDGLMRRGEAHARPGAASVAVWLVLAGLLLSGVRLDAGGAGYGFVEGRFPLQALERYGRQPPGERVFSKSSWGGYLIFCCQPQIPVFFDGRVDTYGAARFAEYIQVLEGEPGWEEVLDRHRVDWALVEPTAPIAELLANSPAWRWEYADETAVVFVRR